VIDRHPPDVAAAASAVRRIADAFLSAHQRHSETVLARGGWDYETEDDRAERRRREDDWLEGLRALEGMLPIGGADWATHGMLRQEIEAAVRLRVNRTELWDVNQMTGWHLVVAHLANTIPVDTPERREQALWRFRELPGVIRARLDDLRHGVSRGYTAAQQAVHRVSEQLGSLLSGGVLESAAARASDAAFASAWREVIEKEVRPALAAYREYLVRDYARVARDTPGLFALPNGLEAYRAEVFRFTSLDLTPEQMLEGADEEMEATDARLRPILARLYAGTTLEEGKQAMRGDPRLTHRSRPEMIEHARSVMEYIRPQLPRFFLHTPDVPLVIEPMTPVEEGIGASGYYQSPEGEAPGRYVLNTAHALLIGRWETTCSAVHEGFPGHHFERAYGDARSTRHPATKELQTQAFREGWAFYGESLASDMGVYDTDVARAGYYMHFLEVWVGLVADVLLHTGRVTRDQAIEILIKRAGRLQHISESRVDRYIAAPGQVTCYMIGYRAVRQLRRDAEQVLGSCFDARSFHDVLLRDGPITLPMQRAKINRWVEDVRHANL
jgi:uncharacterized protein (DUF885 family)